MADYSLYNQYAATQPNPSEEGFNSMLGKLREYMPDATDDDFQTIFDTAAAVKGTGTLTPKGAAYAQLIDEETQKRTARGLPALPTQEEVSGYQAPIPPAPPQAPPAPIPQAAPQAQPHPTRNKTGEAIGGFFAALGGPQVAQQYQSGIELKDKQDKAASDEETSQEVMKQTREEWAQKKREADAKFKESQNLSDPTSDVSKVTREAIKRLASQDPKLGEMLSRMDIDNMSAAQLSKILPFLDKIVDNTTQQLKLQHKKELDDANNEYKLKLLDAKIETLKVGRTGGGSRSSGGRSSGGGQPATVGADGIPKISGIKVDRQGNRSIDPIVARELSNKQKAAELAGQFIKNVPAIRTILPDASQSGVGELVGKAQSFIGVGKTGAANKKMEQFANAALGALNSPLMKGAPSEADARRALSIINDPTAPLNVKEQALDQFESALQLAINSHNDAVSQYDSETLDKLKGVGVTFVGGGNKPPAALTSSPARTRVYNPSTGKLE